MPAYTSSTVKTIGTLKMNAKKGGRIVTDTVQISPNLYELIEAGGRTQITFTPNGSNGKSHLNYSDATYNLSFEGDQEITIKDSSLGRLVTVVLRHTVDAGSTTFTLVIPPVKMQRTMNLPIRTLGVIAENRFSLTHPFEGQLQYDHVVDLEGSAQHI